jgi:UDPglucose 6-dehydrogenase
MDVSVIGTGYVGLVTGACLASLGHRVSCIDTDAKKIEKLRSGLLPIYEPDLDALVSAGVLAQRLEFTTDYSPVSAAQVVFICVGTPSRPSGQADTSAVEAAARGIGQHLGRNYCVVVNKSTVPIGSGDWVGMLVRQGLRTRVGSPVSASVGAMALAEAETTSKAGALTGDDPAVAVDFDVVSNPEFLREGSAVWDALNPDRVVIGVEADAAAAEMRRLYDPLLAQCRARGREVPFVVTDRASAEMIKYAANAFLATKISFINEIANICERVGADVKEVATGIGLDGRVGTGFLNAGLGWGGSCFPKDLASLIHTAGEYEYRPILLEAVRSVNAYQRQVVIRKLQDRLRLIKGKTIALWGLSFKPGTDDLRDAPSLDIATRLTELGAEVKAFDPQAMEAAGRAGLHAQLCADLYEATESADALVIVTEWDEFKSPDWVRIRKGMRRPLLVDGRNCLDRATLLCHGFEYCCIGR